jgi:hypothetical protein
VTHLQGAVSAKRLNVAFQNRFQQQRHGLRAVQQRTAWFFSHFHPFFSLEVTE